MQGKSAPRRHSLAATILPKRGSLSRLTIIITIIVIVIIINHHHHHHTSPPLKLSSYSLPSPPDEPVFKKALQPSRQIFDWQSVAPAGDNHDCGDNGDYGDGDDDDGDDDDDYDYDGG